MRRIVFGILGLLGIALAAAPASAVNVPGCGEFVVFAKNDIIFEAGNTLLFGNIFLQNPTGKIKVGQNNVIHGTVSANRIIVSNGAVVDNCVANVIEIQGTGTCTTSSTPFAPPAACTASFPPPPLVVPAFPVACGPAINATVSQALAPGCYSSVRVGKNVTLTLTPNGEYFVKGELRQLTGSTLIGGTGKPAAAAIVNVAGLYATEPGVFLTNLVVNSTSTSGQAVHIFNNSLLQDVVISTLGNLHPHTGTQLRGNTELIAVDFHDIQPITNEPPPPVDQICVCQPGFEFADQNPPLLRPDRLCVPIVN